MRKAKWLFFDIGSTLVDETEAYAHRIRETIAGTNVSYAQFEAAMRRFAAQGASGYAEAAAYFNLVKAPWHSEDERPYADCASTLKELKARGYSLGVIANQLPGAEARLDAWGLLPFFTVVASSAECGFTKPSPELFYRALDHANCSSKDAVMIGDRLDNDILPARLLGMQTVWIRHGFCSDSGSSVPADAVINTLSDLLHIFR